MVETSIRVSDSNNPNSGYDVYIDGKLVGWARTPGAAQKIVDQHTKTKMADDNPRQREGQNTGNEATGRGGSSILPPTIVLHMSKGSFWAWFFLLLVGFAIF